MSAESAANTGRLGDLIDRNEIIDLFTRYASGIDQRDAALYRSCFADVISIDTSGSKIERGSADEWVALALRAVGIFAVTQHVITNHLVTLDGDEADCTAYLRAQHWNPDGAMMVGGTYTTRLIRTDAGWRISKLVLKVDWTQSG